MPKAPMPPGSRTVEGAPKRRGRESRGDELARLIREQRADQERDRKGLPTTIAQEILDHPVCEPVDFSDDFFDW